MTTVFELGAPTYRAGPETIFDNTGGLTYYFSFMGFTEEWIDTCAFAATDLNRVEQINGFDFNFCSNVPGITPVTAEIRFYDDYVLGAAPTGWTSGGTVQNAACAYSINGLPGGGGGIGGLSCYEIAVDLVGGYECSMPQEQTPGGTTDFVGIGWMFLDPGASSLSGPYLGSTITSAGPGTAMPGYGSLDRFEVMDLAVVGAEHQGSFNFQNVPKAQGTFNIVLYGDGITDTDVVYAEAPNVNDVLTLGSDVEFRTGNAVTWALNDLSGTAVFPSAAYAMLIGRRGNAAGFGTFAGSRTTLLIHPYSFLPVQSPLLMGGAVPSVTTPPLPGLPPTIWAQAFGFNGSVGPGNAAEASNALRHDN